MLIILLTLKYYLVVSPKGNAKSLRFIARTKSGDSLDTIRGDLERRNLRMDEVG